MATCQWCSIAGDDELERGRQIIAEVAQEHVVSVAALVGPSRRATIVAARACAIWRMRKEENLALKQIGLLLGNRDHSTILHHLTARRLRHEDS